MPHTPSAFKRMRQNAKRNLYNRAMKSAVQTALKKAQKAISGDATKAQAEVRAAISQLDKAVSKGVLHRNTVARRKSALMRLAAAAGSKK